MWNARALIGATEVILCDSILDAMTFWVCGFRQVTFSYGSVAADLAAQGVRCVRASLPLGMDVNSFALACSFDPGKLGATLREAGAGELAPRGTPAFVASGGPA